MQNLIKRREQHLKVTKRLVEYYNKKGNAVPENVTAIMLLRIKYAVYQQYKIYLNMPERESYAEIKKFDQWLKTKDQNLYEGPQGRMMKLIKLNRKTGYRLYIPIIGVMKKIKIIR